MALDFQQVREQVNQLGLNAPQREQRLQARREQAMRLLVEHAQELQALRRKVGLVVHNYDASLRCALPVNEPLVARLPLPALPEGATILAADGSQIELDRHAEVEYGLINVGAIQMRLGSPTPPQTTVRTLLLYDEGLYTPTGTLTDAMLALRRDLYERTLLAELAQASPTPVVTFTDGPMELWGSRAESGEQASEFQKSLNAYLQTLTQLCELEVITAGYVDKPAANLVIRLLEVAMTAELELPEIKRIRPLLGVSDIDLYRRILEPGERSAVFAMQSQAAKNYKGHLALHFFYLNVGRTERPWLVRVDIPAWVADNTQMLEYLHAVLIQQCRTMGERPYPYLLHRAHETAVVSLQEREQVTQMIALELRRQGITPEGASHKQVAKDLSGRKRYTP